MTKAKEESEKEEDMAFLTQPILQMTKMTKRANAPFALVWEMTPEGPATTTVMSVSQLNAGRLFGTLMISVKQSGAGVMIALPFKNPGSKRLAKRLAELLKMKIIDDEPSAPSRTSRSRK